MYVSIYLPDRDAEKAFHLGHLNLHRKLSKKTNWKERQKDRQMWRPGLATY